MESIPAVLVSSTISFWRGPAEHKAFGGAGKLLGQPEGKPDDKREGKTDVS